MTKTSFWRIGSDIPPRTRAFLLRSFRPNFGDIRCKTLTHAYRVPENFSFDEGPLCAVIYGRHVAETHEALLLRVGGSAFRPDGQRYFIALSLAPGLEPISAGDIDSDGIEMLDEPLRLNNLAWKRFPLWLQKPGQKAA